MKCPICNLSMPAYNLSHTTQYNTHTIVFRYHCALITFCAHENCNCLYNKCYLYSKSLGSSLNTVCSSIVKSLLQSVCVDCIYATIDAIVKEGVL